MTEAPRANESGEQRIAELQKELDASMQAREAGVQQLKRCADRVIAMTPASGIKLPQTVRMSAAPSEPPPTNGVGITVAEAAPADSPHDSGVRRMPAVEAISVREAQLADASVQRRKNLEQLKRTVSRSVPVPRSGSFPPAPATG